MEFGNIEYARARMSEFEQEAARARLLSQVEREPQEHYSVGYYIARVRRWREEHGPRFVRRGGFGEMHPATFKSRE